MRPSDPARATNGPRMRELLRRLLPALALLLAAAPAAGQEIAPLLYLKHGQLWNSYAYAKTGAPFNNWRRINFGLDWPGFDPEFVNADVGGPASYLLTGGLYFSAKDSTGRPIALDDFAIYASSTSTESGAKYRVSEHRKKYGEGGNFGLKADPLDAEEVLLSQWRANPGWVPQFAGDRQHPLQVRREVRQWGGSMREENYILVEYTLKNVGDSTLFDAYAMLTYAFGATSRAQRVLFPTLTDGARNNQFQFIPGQNVVAVYAEDAPDTPASEALGYAPGFGPRGTGEYLAPGYTGLKVVSVTPNRNGSRTPAGYAFMPADAQQDQQGPFIGKTGFDQQYGVLQNPLTAANASTSPGAAFMRRSRTWSLVSFGPYTLRPGDSVRVAYAEMVAGISYAQATNPAEVTVAQAKGIGSTALLANAARAQFAYDHRYNVPDPPPAPPVAVRLYDAEVGVIANVVTWPATSDAHADADYTGAEANDLAGYRLYRSSYLPVGPWELVADVKKGDAAALQGGTYTFTDRTVQQGNAYYYALTAYDTGHAAWPVDPAARFPETGSNRVPALESSIYANRTQLAFKATIPPATELAGVLVVPNPFRASSGLSNPSEADQIQFVNVPSPSVIRIYSMRGTLVREIRHDDGSGIAFWNQETEYGQFVESGVYLYHIADDQGRTTTGKLAIIR